MTLLTGVYVICVCFCLQVCKSCVYDFVDRCVCHVCMTLLTGVYVMCV